MCTSQVPIIPCIVTCHCSQGELVGEEFGPHKGQKPSCSGTRCGIDTGNCPFSTTENQILSFMSTVSLQAFWIFNNTICLPRNRTWRSLSRHWYSRCAGGLWWHGAGWQVIPLQEYPQTENPNRWLWAKNVAWKGGHAGGFRHESGGLQRKRKCWAGIKWP